MDEETIFAPMTGVGRNAVTALRLSGPGTRQAVEALAGNCPPARRATLRSLRDGQGEVLDRAMLLWLPGPASYTGEDVAELHLHGGRAVLEGVAEALLALGLRLAEPGEFSRRAFLNGRMDLVQAEAVGDLVAAETAGQRRQALRQMAGDLGRVYQGWSDRLAGVLAHQEALIDFPDEALPPEIEAALMADIAALRAALDGHLSDRARGQKMRDGLVFVVQGAPNVGKSSLVNALAGRDVAIVSATPGTTRDVLEIALVLGDAPVTLIDTAGLRETADPVEAEGVRRARARAGQADLIISLVSIGVPMIDEPVGDAARMVVATKADLGGVMPNSDLAVSVLTGGGMDLLQDRLSAFAREATAAAGPPPMTRERHRALVQRARDHLAIAASEEESELRGEELRLALAALGGLTGKVGVEALLDRVFGDFCIGK
jgi:tRNA modification GTPase